MKLFAIVVCNRRFREGRPASPIAYWENMSVTKPHIRVVVAEFSATAGTSSQRTRYCPALGIPRGRVEEGEDDETAIQRELKKTLESMPMSTVSRWW